MLPFWSWSYSITGRVNIGDEWQAQIYMASIEKLSDYYRASADLIIHVAAVQADGSFVLEGNNLPDEQRFYRLYLMKEQNTEYDACLYVGGDDHNFIHVVLDNDDQLEIIADSSFYSPFGNYDVKGNRDNQLMRDLARIVYPSFNFYKIKFPSELRLSEEKLHQDLKIFIDSTQNALPVLAAINNTNFDEFFEQDKAFYADFGERLKATLPYSNYTKHYLRKLSYYNYEEGNNPPNWVLALLFVLTSLLVLAAFVILRLRAALKTAKIEQATSPSSVLPTEEAILDRLTLKEREILGLIQEGKSNKEIASALFVEVSTVKSHINKLYSKLQVSNRKEAMKKALELELK